MLKLAPFFIILILTSCGTKSTTSKKNSIQGLPQNIQLGTSSNDEVKKEMGQPIRTYDLNEKINSVTITEYQDNKAIKFDQDIAKAFFRNPIRDEIYLQYWLQKWKSKSTSQEKISSTKNRHGQYEYQMSCLEDKTTIVYNNENGIVKRVIYYEK